MHPNKSQNVFNNIECKSLFCISQIETVLTSFEDTWATPFLARVSHKDPQIVDCSQFQSFWYILCADIEYDPSPVTSSFATQDFLVKFKSLQNFFTLENCPFASLSIIKTGVLTFQAFPSWPYKNFFNLNSLFNCFIIKDFTVTHGNKIMEFSLRIAMRTLICIFQGKSCKDLRKFGSYSQFSFALN